MTDTITTKGDLLRYLDKCACEYAPKAIVSIQRNTHMNDYVDQPISQEAVDAILVDFVNWVGVHQGLDYGMYTKDLEKHSP